MWYPITLLIFDFNMKTLFIQFFDWICNISLIFLSDIFTANITESDSVSVALVAMVEFWFVFVCLFLKIYIWSRKLIDRPIAGESAVLGVINLLPPYFWVSDLSDFDEDHVNSSSDTLRHHPHTLMPPVEQCVPTGIVTSMNCKTSQATHPFLGSVIAPAFNEAAGFFSALRTSIFFPRLGEFQCTVEKFLYHIWICWVIHFFP